MVNANAHVWNVILVPNTIAQGARGTGNLSKSSIHSLVGAFAWLPRPSVPPFALRKCSRWRRRSWLLVTLCALALKSNLIRSFHRWVQNLLTKNVKKYSYLEFNSGNFRFSKNFKQITWKFFVYISKIFKFITFSKIFLTLTQKYCLLWFSSRCYLFMIIFLVWIFIDPLPMKFRWCFDCALAVGLIYLYLPLSTSINNDTMQVFECKLETVFANMKFTATVQYALYGVSKAVISGKRLMSWV